MKEELPTRSICRFIAILQTINRLSPVCLLTIAKEINVPYPTVSRVIQTLLENELIERIEPTKCYRVTGKTLSLSSGFAEHDRLAMIARERMVALTARVGWPVALSTRVGPSMVVRESTHHLTSLALSGCPRGFKVPLLESAAGHAFLSYASDDERECVLAGLELTCGLSPMMALFKSGGPPSRIREDGYATYERGALDPGKISSIAVPIVAQGRLAGVLTLMLFASAMPIAEALRRYLRDLKSTTLEISALLGSRNNEPGAATESAAAPLREPLRRRLSEPAVAQRRDRRLFPDVDDRLAGSPMTAARAKETLGRTLQRAR